MFLELFEREFGRRIEYEEIVSFDLGRSLDLGPEQLDDFMIAAHRSDELMSIVPIEGAIEALRMWSQAGYAIEVVTGRPPVTAEVSRQWLDRFGVPYDALTFVDKYSWKDSVFEGNTAVPLDHLPRSQYCLAIEDSASVATRLAGFIEAPVVLIDKPWNRSLRIERDHRPGRVTRCENWQEICERFQSP